MILNYDGGIAVSPKKLARPANVEDLCAILSDKDLYPGPVRAKGSFHSLTPCVATDGTIVDMTGMARILKIDADAMTITAEAGLQWIDAAAALKAQGLQFLTNVEIGNITFGSAACCHTKDGLDGAEFGQLSSYATAMKWVTPKGEKREASDATDPATMRMMRSSHGLAGIIYEATFKVKPLEAVRFEYLPRPVEDLTDGEVNELIARSEGLLCWLVGGAAVFQIRTRVEKPSRFGSFLAASRRRLWNHSVAHVGRLIDAHAPNAAFRNFGHDLSFSAFRATYRALAWGGGYAFLNPEKTVDYRRSPPSCRYAFTFWSFPAASWLAGLKSYVPFAEAHFKAHGFRCNMPLGAYYIRKDQSGVLSYSYDGDTFSLDPIHAVSDKPAWDRFLGEFNEFAYRRHGIPLLNQTPFVQKKHVADGYGERWREFSNWVRRSDPDGRMLNPFFADLL